MAKRHSDGSEQTEQHTRRDYVRLGGTALAATAVGGVGATTAVAADTNTAVDDHVSHDDAADDGELTNVLLIDGTVSTELAQYKIVVTGRIERSDSHSSVDDEASPWDQISDRVEGSTATGVVAHAIDGYRYSGELVSIQLNGNVNVTLEEAP